MNLLQAVNEYLEEKDYKESSGYKKVNGEWVLIPRSSHHPSGYNKCLRQMYYSWTREPVTNRRSATDVYRMLIGKWIHNGFADVLKEMYGDKVRSEVEVYYKDNRLEFPIHGFIDNVIDLEDNYKQGVELKSVFGRGATAIKNSGQPREDDEAQTKVYLSITDINAFALPYLARDNFYRVEFDIVMTEKEKEIFKEKMVEKFLRLELAVKAKVVPARDYHAVVKDGEVKESIQYKTKEYKSDWQCSYCIWRDKCYEAEIESMDICIPKQITGK